MQQTKLKMILTIEDGKMPESTMKRQVSSTSEREKAFQSRTTFRFSSSTDFKLRDLSINTSAKRLKSSQLTNPRSQLRQRSSPTIEGKNSS